MIRFLLSLLGLLFIQAGVMGHLHSPAGGDVYSTFGDGLRDAVTYDTGLVRRVGGLVGLSSGESN